MIRLAATAFVLALSTGCVVPATLLLVDALDGDGPGVDYYQDSNVSGQMRGELPVTGAFDRELSAGSLWRWEDTIDLELQVEGGGWAMLGGGFDLTGVDDGETVVLGPDEHWVYGCSGASVWNAEFDEPAEEVVVTQERIELDGEELVQLTIIATFADDHEVTAVVVEPVPAPGGEG
ncbi:MAG: hypothetical protein R3F61_14385 [Myxococcota bacterium]